jgi:hypothetical protein
VSTICCESEQWWQHRFTIKKKPERQRVEKQLQEKIKSLEKEILNLMHPQKPNESTVCSSKTTRFTFTIKAARRKRTKNTHLSFM